MELIKAGKNTYYIKNPTNIGIYKINNKDVYLIDSGNDKEAGKKILKIVEEQGWNIKAIINTHSNADHIGGNKLIQDKTNCKIFSYDIETAFINNPILETSFLYGGYPFKDLKNKFLLAKESHAENISKLPESLDYFMLRGHFFDMIGIRTSDNIVFLGDSIFSEEIISKYSIFFIYDVREYLNTLDYLETINASLYIPSHGIATNNIDDLIQINRNKIYEIMENICNYCDKGVTFEEIVKFIFEKYSLVMNVNQYYLVSSTIKSYMSYLYDENKLVYEFLDNTMLWRKKNE